jgi:hypothetical protein
MVAYTIEDNLAPVNGEIGGILPVRQLKGLRDGLHALAYCAEILEKLGERPHDPAGHGTQAQGQRSCRRHRAEGCMAAMPEVDRDPDDRDD